MSDNVLINGRSAVHAGSNGMLTTVDVCKTIVGNSTVPIPYANVAQSKDADKAAENVLINGNPACHVKSVFAKSAGDEPGSRKGISSGKIQGEASFTSSSFDVLIEGQPAVRAMDMMVSNNKNTPPAPLMQAIGMPPIPTEAEEAETIEPEDINLIGMESYAERSFGDGEIAAEDPQE